MPNRRPVPPMVRCMVQVEDKPPCEALVFVRERSHHLEEMHAIHETGEEGLRKWFKPLPKRDEDEQ